MFKIEVYFTMFGLALLLACSGANKKAADAGGDESEAVTPVETATAKRQPIQHLIKAEAVLYPIAQANVVPKISAPVQKFFVNRGDHVKQGQLLATLEARDLTASAQESKDLYTQAQSTYQTTTDATMQEDLTKATTDVHTAKQSLDQAKSVYDSRVALFKEGALAAKLVEDAKLALVQAQGLNETAVQHLHALQTVTRPEQAKGAKAQLDAAKAHYQSSAAQASYAEIRSPISGIISDRSISIGEIASSSASVVSIVDISQVIARANVPVGDAAAIRVGRPATISGPGGELEGKVTVVSPAVDPNTTTVQIWVQAKNTEERFRPGITVQLSVDADEIPDAIVVPAAALLSSDDGSDKVLIAGADSLAHEQKVEVGVRDKENVQIASGVKEGQQVITVGGLGLDDKAKIQVEKPGAKDDDATKKEGADK